MGRTEERTNVLSFLLALLRGFPRGFRSSFHLDSCLAGILLIDYEG
jgi:hypothetical protein